MSPQQRQRRLTAARLLVDVILVLSVAGVLTVTLLPTVMEGVPAREATTAVNLDPGHTIETMWRWGSRTQQYTNLVLNVVLFIPLGISLALKARTSHPILAAVFGGADMSVLVELGQYLLPLSRSTDVDDVILNVLGAAIGGILAVATLPTLRRAARGQRTSRSVETRAG